MPKFPWIWWIILTLYLCLVCWNSYATEVKFIPGKERLELESAFNKATPYLQPEGTWVCDMYGVRSNLQVMHNLKLYSFARAKDRFANRGVQMVPVYRTEAGEMRGFAPVHQEKMQDDLRMTKDAHLVSRLTQVSSGQVVAYSVCQRSSS